MRGPRVLYVSGSIGLGHVSKDLAIARELRHARPGLEIVWLAGHPAGQVLRDAGELLVPESQRWIGASAIAERCTHDGRLNLVRYVYRSLPSWARNTGVFLSAVRAHRVDMAIGNEAWEVDIPLVLGVLRLPVPFVMIFDFVGCDVMAPSVLDSLGAYGLNALWALDGHVFNGRPALGALHRRAGGCPGHGARPGTPEQALPRPSPLPLRGPRDRVQAGRLADRSAWRRAWDTATSRSWSAPPAARRSGAVCWSSAARRVARAARASARRPHGACCGPRLPVGSLQTPEGVDVLGYVPRLHEHFACSDVAVVQCGASSTTELAALRRPFVYFPVDGHFEQEIVAARLARYGVGRRMSLAGATPESLAAAILGEYARSRTQHLVSPNRWRPQCGLPHPESPGSRRLGGTTAALRIGPFRLRFVVRIHVRRPAISSDIPFRWSSVSRRLQPLRNPDLCDLTGLRGPV